MRLLRFLSLFVSLIALSSLTSPSGTAQGERLQVAVSTPLLADIVQNVTGDIADVYSIMPPNTDPHTWEASPQDIVRVTEADTFISVGAHLEPFVESGGWRRAVIDGGVSQLVIADEIELIEVDRMIDHGDHVHDLREGDPHFWLGPTKVIEAVPVIAGHLSTLDPGGAETYNANAAAYATVLEELDAELEAAFAAIPPERRVLVVFHDAYTYFAARYGFEVVGVVIQNPEVEVSAQEVVELQGIIDDYGMQVIFAEPQFNTAVLDIFVEAGGVEVGELLTDTFSGTVDSYVELMRFNRDSLVRHLGE